MRRPVATCHSVALLLSPDRCMRLTLLRAHICFCRLQHAQETGSTRFVVLVVYVGGEQAATALVDTAEVDLNQIGALIENVANATDGAITLKQVCCGWGSACPDAAAGPWW